jgi:2-polyprenyl-6-methoxyphenol hydroxylase-like FAD-dependent oxidoreductase
MMPDEKPQFRVIIVGGGIAGLTLANSLQHVGVEFLVLEARSEIAPQIGASIGLAPNGSRILDQLCCYEDMEKLAEPVQTAGYHDANGNELCPRTDGFQLIQARWVPSWCFRVCGIASPD